MFQTEQQAKKTSGNQYFVPSLNLCSRNTVHAETHPHSVVESPILHTRLLYRLNSGWLPTYDFPFFRDVILEKHWKSVIHRSICDYFFDAQKKAASPEDVSPVLSTPHHYLINVYHNQVYFLAVTTTEIPPLMVIEFLHRVVYTFSQYFDECSDTSIKENCVMLLDEMLDNGYPLVTELNILQDLIKPPNFLRSIANQVTGRTNHSETLPTGQLSNIPWRRQGVKYTNNEAYFDVIEEIDAIIDKQGATVFAEIQGYVSSC
ncbi:unnamed protein product [Cylicostephanus goldi]|uniref:MHD domain-containing protein n=1 Tax=Cylicostephanus goldi TaxID=71465 RepID=A0A3P6QPN3_CYLGO|nr:unnamed protein product [Cylicostephanus goldi]